MSSNMLQGVGQIDLAAGQVCRESRAAMKLTHAKVEAQWSASYHEGQMFPG